MTIEEARREISKANSRLYRLREGFFKGKTPATRTLEKNLKKLGLELTKKGFISTKGLKSSQLLGAGRQAQLFSSYKTATTRGAKKDIATRISTFQSKAKELKVDITPEQTKRIWDIFEKDYYKRLKETAGSDIVVSLVIRQMKETPDIDITSWLEQREEEYAQGKLTAEQLFFKTDSELETISDEDIAEFLEEFD